MAERPLVSRKSERLPCTGVARPLLQIDVQVLGMQRADTTHRTGTVHVCLWKAPTVEAELRILASAMRPMAPY